MKNVTHQNFFFLIIIFMFFSFNYGMNNKTINRQLKKTQKKMASPVAIKPIISTIENSAHKSTVPDRSLSPTLSPSTLPRKCNKRSRSPLGGTPAKIKELDNKKAIVEYAKKGNLLAVKNELNDLDETIPLGETLGEILQVAIDKNHFNIVRYVLENYTNVNMNYRGTKNQTLLINAAKKGSFALVNYLICFGADINAQSVSGNTPLHKAAKFGHVEAMRLLLNKKEQIKINARNLEQKTPLFIAVEKAQFHAYDLLRSHGAQVTVIGQGGRNLLHAAVLSGYLPILLNLIETTDLDLDARDGHSHSPLDIARQIEDQTLVNALECYKNKRDAKNTN